MDVGEAFHFFNDYDLWLIIIGLAVLATTILPRMLSAYPFSMPIALLMLGYLAVALPTGLNAPDLETEGHLAERITELGVIISLTGAGLKIDRKLTFKKWSSTWRLLGITMILTIIFTAIVGWWLAALVPAAALLLGAAIAPTDPVLAAEVQVGAPGAGSKNLETEEDDVISDEKEDEVRFALTSEAGLNDGLAFPFTNLAIAIALVGISPSNWLSTWFFVDVLYKLGIAVLIGWGMGYVLASIILNMEAKTKIAVAIIGIGALASTLIIYGVTQYFSGYGFIATFIGALVIRNYEREHDYHEPLHILIEKTERIFVATILIGLGAAMAEGLLMPISWQLVVCALLIVLVIRPLSGIIGLLGLNSVSWRERLAISFLGIKGIGSIYYLTYALNKTHFEGADKLWTVTALVIIFSIVIHGITATPITKRLDKLRRKEII